MKKIKLHEKDEAVLHDFSNMKPDFYMLTIKI